MLVSYIPLANRGQARAVEAVVCRPALRARYGEDAVDNCQPHHETAPIASRQRPFNYLDGNPPTSIPGADLLQVTTESWVNWTVDSTNANQPLYLYADNEDGRGGDGQTTASFTVIITLTPLLDATITDDSLAVVDVEQPRARHEGAHERVVRRVGTLHRVRINAGLRFTN